MSVGLIVSRAGPKGRIYGPHRALTLGLVLALAFRPLAPALGAVQEAGPGRSWSVELRAPDERQQSWPTNPNLTLETRPEGLRLLRSDRTLVDIPGQRVVGVIYDTAVYRPVVAYFRTQGPGVAEAAADGTIEAVAEVGPPGMFALPVFVALFVVVPAVLLAPFVKTQHFISIVWREGDRARDVILQVKGGERDEILAAISGATGVIWRDVPAERQRLGAEIATAARLGFPVKLKQDAFLAGSTLEAGRYQGLVLVREASPPELLLFRGRKAKFKKLVVRTPVALQSAEAAVKEATVTYRVEPAGTTLAEVHTGGSLIVLPEYRAPDLGLETASPGQWERVVRFESGLYARATAALATLDEEPAFVFRVLRLSFQHPSSGELYVTPTQLVYDASSLIYRFTAPRSDLRKVRIKSILGGSYLALVHEKDAYSFRMISTRDPSVNLVEWTFHGQHVTRVERQVAEFARLAIEDFAAATSQFEAWEAGGGLVSISEESPPSTRDD